MVNFLFKNKSNDSKSSESEESIPELTSDNILEFPWNLWRDLKKADSFFRKNLSNSLYYTLQLRLFRQYLQEEFSKKRSRKSSAVRRAYKYSRTDAKNVSKTLSNLDLDQLWKILDVQSSFESRALNARLDAFISKDQFQILKNEDDGLLKNEADKIAESEDDTTLDEDSEKAESESLSDSSENLVEEENIASKDDSENIEDKFFKLDEMEAFANEDFQEEDDIDYFDSLGEESDSSVPAADMKYSDFFRDPDESDSELVEELKPLTCSKDLKHMDEYDKEMELMLQKLENGYETSDDHDDVYRDEIDEEFDEDDQELEEYNDENENGNENEELNGVDKNMDEIGLKIEQLHHDLVAPKHWSMMGECSGKNRPRNSLLDLDLDLPQASSVIHENHDQTPEEPEQQQEELPLEMIIVQRIKSGVFDNVERKLYQEDHIEAIDRLKKNKTEETEINFNKDEMGLGEVYANKYKEQFMALDKLDSHKKALADQFAKIVYKLDALSNSTFVPKRISESEKVNNLPTISVETPVNIAISDPPRECVVPKTQKVSRSTKKRKFKNKMKGLIKSGKLTSQEVESIKKKMLIKNKKMKEEAKSKRQTGLSLKDNLRNSTGSYGKINTTQLLSSLTN